MNQYLPLIITKLMFLTAPALAQKANGISMKWEIAAELPAVSGQKIALGVAGPVTGIYKDKLFVGGGANFPIAMPWQGGVKKYHATIHIFSAKHGKLKLLAKSFSLLTLLLTLLLAIHQLGFCMQGVKAKKVLVIKY